MTIHAAAASQRCNGDTIPSLRVTLQRSPDLVMISDTPKGRGIFATRPIPARTTVDVSPVLVLSSEDNDTHLRHTQLHHYTYNWPCYDPQTRKTRTAQSLILGLGSLFNHSTAHQNVGWERDVERGVVRYTALRDIEAGEELCISYGSRLTFEDAEAGERRGEVRETDLLEELARIELD